MHGILLAILTQLPAAEPAPQIRNVGMVAPDVVVVTLREGDVALGELVPYEPGAADETKEEGTQKTTVRRAGGEIGTLGGPAERRMLRTLDQFSGARLDRERLVDPAAWSLAGGPRVRSVSCKNLVRDAANVEWGDWKAAFDFIVYLSLESPLPPGEHAVEYRGLKAFDFTWDERRTVSPAVHVSAVGFRPDDPGKRATLTCWMGDGGALDYLQRWPELGYRVVDDESGREVLSGTVVQRQGAEEDDDFTGMWGRPNGAKFNRAGGPVFTMDLGGLTTPGGYRVVVDGVGSSRPFRIDRDVYDGLWRLALRGLHVHRRNLPVDVESVDGERWTRPAADDSSAVHSRARFDNATFDVFQQGATSEPAPQTRGGWMDAGDYDSNHNHYWASLLLLDLIDRHPQALSADDVGISDSGNGRPDLLDEALWMIDSYRAMQSEDGSVPSGIEYSEHPRTGEPSYLNTLPIYRLAASPLANYRFAAATARAARVLQDGGFPTAVASGDYLGSAAAAFRWAEAHRSEPAPDSAEAVDEARQLASCELQLAGRNAEGQVWRDAVVQLADKPWSVVQPTVCEAIVSTLRTGGTEFSATQRDALATILYQTATMAYLDGSTRRSGFGVLKHGWAPFGFGVGGCPQAGAHHVVLFPTVVPTNDPYPPHITPDRDEYIAAGVTGLAFLLGHHPTNRPFVTGLETLPGVDDSWESVWNILHLDSRYGGHRAPVGITVYGAVRPVRDGTSWPINWPLNRDQTIHPQYELWPEYENLHEFPLWGAMMEYTVWQSIAPTIWLAGELHARDG